MTRRLTAALRRHARSRYWACIAQQRHGVACAMRAGHTRDAAHYLAHEAAERACAWHSLAGGDVEGAWIAHTNARSLRLRATQMMGVEHV